MMKFITGIMTLVTSFLLTSPTLAQSPEGVWLDEDRNAHIQIYKCSKGLPVKARSLQNYLCRQAKAGKDRLCGRVVSVTRQGIGVLKKKGKKVRDIMNIPVLCVSKTSKKQWKGGLYSVYLDIKASGLVKIRSRSRILVKGCKYGLFCAQDIWTRVR